MSIENTNNYLKNRVLYQSLKKIEEMKMNALRDVVAYANDPVRYRRRLRFLKELTVYEKTLIENFENFVSDNPSDDFDENTLKKIRESIDQLTLLNS